MSRPVTSAVAVPPGRLLPVEVDGRHGWDSIARTLTQRIRTGEIPVNGYLPTITEIRREFGVARETARRAVNDLRARGIVETRPGARTVVVAVPVPDDEEPPASVTRLILGRLADHDQRITGQEESAAELRDEITEILRRLDLLEDR